MAAIDSAQVFSELLALPSQKRYQLILKYRKRMYERSLYEFEQAVWHIIEPGREFLPNYHIQAIAEHLEAVTAGQIRRLIVNVPPGTGKSILISVAWPCWTWIKDPYSRWIFASYKAENTLRDSRRRREILKSKWFRRHWWEWRIKQDQDTAHRFENSKQGFMLATSVGGGGTGEHGNYLVFDDPHDRMDRYSKTKRDTAINWERTVLSSLNLGPETRHVVVAQRITEDDQTGTLLAQELGYEHLCIPLLWESGHPHMGKTTSLGWCDPRTQEGENMWPAMFPDTAELKRQKGSYDFSAQFQQRPAPDQGGVFSRKNFRYFRTESMPDGEEVLVLLARDGDKPVERRVMASDCWWFQTCDTALETKDTSAWTVVGTFAVTPAPVSLLVYDVARERVPVPQQFGFLLGQRQKHPRVQVQAVERKASGIGLLQEGAMRGMAFSSLIAKGSKEQRCLPVATQYENGMVYHRIGAHWLDTFESEMLFFPAGQFADQVDVLAYAGLMVQRQCYYSAIGDESAAYVEEPEERAAKRGGDGEPKWKGVLDGPTLDLAAFGKATDEWDE